MVGEVNDDRLQLIAEHARTTRLAMGMAKHNVIPDEKAQETIDALGELIKVAVSLDAGHIRLAATGALRSAKNGRAVAERIKEQTQRECEILTEKEESFLSFHAVRDLVLPDGPLTVADVGGATMEIISGKSAIPDEYGSFPLGCIPVTEEWFSRNPPGETAWHKARKAICDRLPSRFDTHSVIVGCGGAFTSTAALVRGLKRDQVPLRGYPLNEITVTEIGLFASTLTVKTRYALPGIGEARSILVPAGTAIISALLSKWGKSCLVSDRGMAWGLLLDTWKQVESDT